MDFDFTEAEENFRKEVRSWLERNLPDDLKGKSFAASRGNREEFVRLRWWQRTMYEAGYVGMDWPREFGGRGASLAEMVILYQEMGRAESPQIVNRGGVSMLGPTLMKHGTPKQQQRHLRNILTADEMWCQGFSEPNAGSDLANLQTRAVRDGDHYVVNGQKVWTSMGHVADWCFLLVRTDPGAAKHKGISFLLVDMKTPGITVRPLRQLTGEAEFNETFFDNVRVPLENLVGKENEGWGVAITTLAHERDVLTHIRHISLRNALQRLIRMVKERGANADPIVRQKIAHLYISEQALQFNGYRGLTNIMRGGHPGPEGSTAKLLWSQTDVELAQTATQILGPYSQLTDGPTGRRTKGSGSSTSCWPAAAASARARRRSSRTSWASGFSVCRRTEADVSPTLRSEVESFRHFIFSTIDSIVGALDGLSADELNWRPAAPATNSLYAIATHVLGNAEENLLGTLCRQPYTRNYAGEFIAAASVPDAVRAQWADLRERLAKSFEALTRDDLDGARQHPRRGIITGRDVLIVVARHAAEHWGEAQLTRSLLKARTGGRQS